LSWWSGARDDEPTELPKTHIICVAVHCECVSLRIAIFIIGYRNRFGHPKQEIVQRYV
jgi:hypothetical protein